MEYWTIKFDGSLQLQVEGAGILVTSPKGDSFKYVMHMHFPASNNVAEYETLLRGPRIATALDIHVGAQKTPISCANMSSECIK
jgi:hypothetical protein